MRIQHNIAAMSSYRNYTNNVSAVNKNLEKLSSGYKINRAGDDAAGLAISEKMRAQISGLEAAQKNAKDGISLVQTAEGALTEVHDMLNRMVTLATQSANGTYDNETDRAQLQKEVQQLKDEINRIADSANFNGIKLLDGSMDATPIAGAVSNLLVKGELPEVGQVLGDNTVLHNKATDPTKAQFGVTLHNVSYSNDGANATMSINLGDDKITLTGGASKATMTGGAVSTPAQTQMTIGNLAYDVEGDNLEAQLKSWISQFNADDANNGGELTASLNAAKDGVNFTATHAGALNLPAGTGFTPPTAVTAAAPATLTAKAANDSTTVTVSGDLAAATINWGDTTSLGAAGVADMANKTITLAWQDGTSATIKLVTGTAADATATAGEVKISETDGLDDVATNIQSALTAVLAAKNAAKNAENAAMTTAGDTVNQYTATLNLATDATTAATATGGYKGQEVTAANVAKTGEYASGTVAEVGKLTVDNKEYAVSGTTVQEQLQSWANKFNTDKTNTANKNWVASVNDAGNAIVYTAKKAGSMANDAWKTASGASLTTDGQDSPFGTNEAMTADQIIEAIMAGGSGVTLNGQAITDVNDVVLSDGAHYKLEGSGYTLTFTQLADDNGTADLDRTVYLEDSTGKLEVGKTGTELKGDYNVSTVFNKPDTAASIDRLASTYFELDSSKVADGTGVFIGGTTYKFSADEADKNAEGKVYIGDMVDDKGKFDASDDNMKTVAERLTVAAKNNEVYTVGYDQGTGMITVTETLKDGVAYTDQAGAEYDLTKYSEIERSLGYVAADTPSEGKSLTLQIGDTADEYNQLKVNIKDCHTKSIGVEDVDIGTQEGAAKAVDAIKAAINYVSDVRGTLGATQNRLEHTINNLSVMTENIQDAESTIRDTDIAEEMMAYTKNNILVQSAQAMLAQANQIPQGVLQLLG